MISCSLNVNQERNLNYKETQTSFFDLAHGDWITNKWIRKPENLKMIHETFKKFGYWNLITDDFVTDNEFMIRDIYIKKNFFQLFDSLLLTYNLDTIERKYYREFWQRREMENNDSIVYEIVKEINLLKRTKLVHEPKYVNDTLFDLLRIQFRKDSLTDKLARQDFEALKKYGFHQSAYNLLYERYSYYDIDWNRDSLVLTLDTTQNYVGAWIQDNTK
jgi:hypothetical protein